MKDPIRLFVYNVQRRTKRLGPAAVYFDGEKFFTSGKTEVNFAELIGVYNDQATVQLIYDDIVFALGGKPFAGAA